MWHLFTFITNSLTVDNTKRIYSVNFIQYYIFDSKYLVYGLYELFEITYMKTLTYFYIVTILYIIIIECILPITISSFAVTANKSMMEMCHLGLSDIRKNVYSI